MLLTRNPLRYATCGFVLVLSLAAFHTLYLRLISQIYYTKAIKFQKDGSLGLAAQNYKKAAAYQPRDAKIWHKLAEAHLSMGNNETSPRKAFFDTNTAKELYLRAARHNPLDPETAYGLARAESRLEQLYQNLHPKEQNTPYHPLPYFERAIQLRPADINVHYALARYFFHHGQKEALFQTVRSMVRMYPPAYHYLKKAPLWSPSVKNAVKKGLEDAVQARASLASAHRIMAEILDEDKDMAGAIVHYRRALEFEGGNISAQENIYLGRLYLRNNQAKEAEIHFIQGLDSSTSMENAFEDISRIYRDVRRADDYSAFYQTASRRRAFSPEMHVIAARCLIDLKQYDRARRSFMDLNRETPLAEAYYGLARIAEIEKDWDQMELNVQRATVLEPSNMTYRRMFYGLLKRLGKDKTAEREIGLMIQYSKTPSPLLFNERATLRLKRQDYTGAVEDWKAAVSLAPKQAQYYANIAEAHIKLGALPPALEYYEKAINLDPGNKGYVDKYKQLKGESS